MKQGGGTRGACPANPEGFPLCICNYFPLKVLRHGLLGEGTGLGCLCCLCTWKCHCWCCFLGWVCVFAYNVCLMFVQCACWGYTSVLPLPRPGDMQQQQQQLHPTWDARFSKLKCRLSTLCANGKRKWTNEIGT